MNESNYFELTKDDSGHGLPRADVAPGCPSHIGRFKVEKILGIGGFGVVYLAFDEQLNRPVAIKVPHAKLVARPQDAKAYLAEARTVAKLDHPNIIQVHDVGQTSEYPCFIVSKYVEGIDLRTMIREALPRAEEAIKIIATIADALQYAHTQGLVHRDIKLSNILIAQNGKPYLVDFGLALSDENFGRCAKYAGTPGYMSPEQARGEGHRVDGRSDIFSLGVTLYRLLVGRAPFQGKTQDELLEQLTSVDPRPLRQYDARISKELERICFKAMARKARDRYSTAFDMAEDLRHLMNQSLTTDSTVADQNPITASGEPESGSTLSKSSATARVSMETIASNSQTFNIVPKGLRSFDDHDSDFILELIPGPYDRNGIPESVRFWKSRILETDTDRTFEVGLIYGPSGCGKTSLVKAALLPRLDESIIPIYVEATPDETESRLLNGLRRFCPMVDKNLDLKDSITALRQGATPIGGKVLIVLDQFEQWLNAKKDEEYTELVKSLRQCDGTHVQCIVMVRDDFWMAVTRFLSDLEVRLEQDRNFATVDLFPLPHAKKVLAAFGTAFGVLPINAHERTKEQEAFLSQSVEGLAREGRIICVRLALFAEMMKGKPWTPATLEAMGGTKGVGVAFLEETFSVHNNPSHRAHQKAARAVLNDLLPDSGTNIKGGLKSETQLKRSSGYEERRHDFEELIRILDNEMRLITPTDPAGLEDWQNELPDEGQKYYQLTHDYLVPSLRQWLTKKLRETRKGRAELELIDRTHLWHERQENQQLPTFAEYLQILTLTEKRKWTALQRSMMNRASVFYASWAAIVTVIALAIGGMVYEFVGRSRAASMVAELSASEISEVPQRIELLDEYGRWVNPLLLQNANLPSDRAEYAKPRLHSQLALTRTHPEFVGPLFDQLLESDPRTLKVIRGRLVENSNELSTIGWQTFDREASSRNKLNAACALAIFAPGNDENWIKHGDEIAALLIEDISQNVGHFEAMTDMLEPVRLHLAQPLSNLARDNRLTALQKETAFNVVLRYGHDQIPLLSDLLCDAGAKRFERLITLIEEESVAALRFFRDEMARSLADLPSEEDSQKVWLGQRQANAAIARLRLGESDAPENLFLRREDPRATSWFIHRVADYAVDPSVLIEKLTWHPTSPEKIKVEAEILLSLGQYNEQAFPGEERAELIAKLIKVYIEHPDSYLHGVSAWLLNRWERAEELPDWNKQNVQTAADFMAREDTQRNWYVNPEGQTMVMIQAEPFTMGSPFGIGDYADQDERHFQSRISHPFEICDSEVIWNHLKLFADEVDSLHVDFDRRDGEAAATGMSWFQAAHYCNWLSEKEGLPKSEWCYRPNDDGEYGPGMRIKSNFLELKGYRLPTEAEWEFACRAGTQTLRHFGFHESLLKSYARYKGSSEKHVWPGRSKMPNQYGLFDMYGNTYEWCQDRYANYPNETIDRDVQRMVQLGLVDNRTRVLRGGSFQNPPGVLHSSNRNRHPPAVRYGNHGFRIARSHK